MSKAHLVEFLNRKVKEYNQPAFIANDPICVPHAFSKQQDIEISGFFAAIFAWGNRTTIIQKARTLMQLMDNAPYQFVRQHSPRDLKKLFGFRHRTFNSTDLLYFVEFLKFHYATNDSLETAFSQWMRPGETDIQNGLDGFYRYFFSLDANPPRTHKHIACPQKNSSCKRLNMFLRWMIRKDNQRVDFGLWGQISQAQLICPIDLHVARVARKLGLITRNQPDWQAALELTGHLRKMDRNDPVKYDFALFGLGVMEKFG